MQSWTRWGAPLAIATGLALAASSGAMAEQVTLQWQSSNLAEAQFQPIWKKMVAAFEKEHPDIKIEADLVGRQDAWTKFVTAAQAHQAACIVSVPVPTAAYDGYLMPLDDLFNAEPESYRKVWTKGALNAVTFDGKLYGLPFFGGIYGEIYNADMVKAAGLDPNNPPKTWDEYLTWTKALTGKDHWATAVLAGPTDTTTRVLLSWIYSNGGHAFTPDMKKATFAADPKSLEAIEFYLSLASKYHVTAPSPASTNYNEQTVMFAQGKIANMRNAYWGIAKVLGDAPELKDKLIVTPPPGNSPDAHTVATVTATSISSSCQHPKQAWEFLKYMTSPQWAAELVTAANWMPLRTDVVDQPAIASDPVVQKFFEMGATATTIPLPTQAWTQIASRDVVDAMQQALEHPDQTKEIFTHLDEVVTERLNEE